MVPAPKTVVVADEAVPVRSSGRKARNPYEGVGKKLTQREREILRLICSGKTSKAIAQQLNISPRTVEVHRGHLLDKLAVGSIAELMHLVNGQRH